MTRKTKSKSPGEVVGRVTSALIECPLTADEVRSLQRIESRRQEAEREQRQATTQDQKARAYAKAAQAGEMAVELAQKVNARRDARWSSQALAELDALADLRGEDLAQTQVGARVRISPLLRLFRARLLDEAQYEALKQYGKTYERLYGGARGDGTGSGELDPLESRVADIKRLDRARGYDIAEFGGRVITNDGLGGDARLISLCDRVAGEEQSLREVFGTSGAKRKQGMDRLKLSGNLLAIYYGLRKVREEDLRAA